MEIQLDLAKTPFSLDYTLSCGQTFRWEKRGAWWIGVADQTAFKIRQARNSLEFDSSTHTAADFLWRYFRLDDNLPIVYSKIVKDEYVREAVKRFRGLRLLRQEPWECTVSYLCAQNKNIPAIKQMIFNLCRRFGDPVMFEGEESYKFPEPKALAKASLKELRQCKLGYRAENVLKTAKLVAKGDFDLDALQTMSYASAKEELLTLPGVGPKVADCILLFSLDKLEGFPIDVWMRRIILEYYSKFFNPEFVKKMKAKKGLSPHDYETIYAFGREYFGEYLGYAQEYLYHNKRCQTGLDRISTKESW
jgi:N-glycosylase/DNA lyase